MRADHDDSTAWALAAKREWLITHEELGRLGYTRGAIRHRVATGRLWPVFPGVYAVGHPEMTPKRLALAAVLACGEGCGLGYLSAGWLWRVWERQPPGRPIVIVPTDHGRRGPPGLDVRRSRTLAPSELTTHDGVPVTNLMRTIADNAADLSSSQLRSMIRQAERAHRLDLYRLAAYADARSSKSFRHRRILRALDGYLPVAALTASEREALLFELCQRHGLPMPSPQMRVGPYVVDFLWADRRLIVELDDRSSHDTTIAFTDDRARDRALIALGYTVLRFTVAELQSKPATVARELAIALARTAA